MEHTYGGSTKQLHSTVCVYLTSSYLKGFLTLWNMKVIQETAMYGMLLDGQCCQSVMWNLVNCFKYSLDNSENKSMKALLDSELQLISRIRLHRFYILCTHLNERAWKTKGANWWYYWP